jgi:serine/threonine protein kinase
MKGGLLFDEASCGTLQSYIDGDSKIDDALRRTWSLQIAKALAHVHEKGIVHSNLSTTNVLVHDTGETLDLLLADFGGSRCLELNLDGNLLPDHAYLDPQATIADFHLPKLDVFSLGVVLYIIVTGHYPFGQSSAPEYEESFTYGDRVQALYKEGKFPSLSGMLFGDVIAGCCCERRFETAREVFLALEAEMQHVRRLTLLAFVLKLTWQRGTL